jgi:hypothetical protein
MTNPVPASDPRLQWPHQNECRNFYGNPSEVVRGIVRASKTWEGASLTTVIVPWAAHASWDRGLKISRLRVHKKCADSLSRILSELWIRAGRAQVEIDRVGLSSIGGAHNWRLMRGGNALSMHSYGCAIDFDPERNGMGDTTPNFGRPENRYVVDMFAAEGWVWGGAWRSPDGMHFQAART